MSHLMIRDLSESKVLDQAGLNEIKGGMYQQPLYPTLFGISSATAGADAYAIGPNGSYADTYTNASAFRHPFLPLSVANANSYSVALAY